MGQFTYTYRVDVPPEAVFELGSKPERQPEWYPSVIEVKDVSGPLDRVGAKYTQVTKIAGRPLETHWEVTRIEKPFYFEAKGTTPGGGSGTYIAKAQPMGTGTEVTVEFHYELPGGFLGQFADKLFVEHAIERDFKHAAENFKAIVEAEVLMPV